MWVTVAYIYGQVESIISALNFLSVVFLVVAGLSLLYSVLERSEKLRKFGIVTVSIGCVLYVLSALTPNQETIKYMAGAYVGEQVIESDQFQAGLSSVGDAATNTLEGATRTVGNLNDLANTLIKNAQKKAQDDEKAQED